MSTAPSLRLHLFHAREASKTVILRQGPSSTYRMILWDRDGERFQDRQWLKYKVDEDRCDLSPDGAHFTPVVAPYAPPAPWHALNGDQA